MSEEECEEENCEECQEHCPEQTKGKKQDMNMKDFLKKFGKYIKFGKTFDKGTMSKELAEFFTFSRSSVDKSFITAQPDLNQASVGMEKAFEILMRELKEQKIEPTSFTLGIIFGLSRWSFLESEIIKKISEKKLKENKVMIA